MVHMALDLHDMDLAWSVSHRLVRLAIARNAAPLVIALVLASDATAHMVVPNEATTGSDQPALIGPGVISTRDYERDEALSPDGHTLYFTKRTIWPYFSVICVSRLVHGHWTEPEIAPFSGRYPDATPAFAPNGKTLYFASRRPVEESAPLRRDYDLWAVDATAQGWSQP